MIGEQQQQFELDDSQSVINYMENYEMSLPCFVDGLNNYQRKILSGVLNRNKSSKEIRVSQLLASIIKNSNFTSETHWLETTLISMSQNFTGSNNLNLLLPIGLFGTRLAGGGDSADTRYIFTKASPFCRVVFHPDDDCLLSFVRRNENHRLEPEWYIPIIPMALVNGSYGIEGYSEILPRFNPKDIVQNLCRLLEGKGIKKMRPWYRGFKGDIMEWNEDGVFKGWILEGVSNRLNNDYLRVTELPVGKWTYDFKSRLEVLSGEKSKNKLQRSKETIELERKRKESVVKRYRDNSTDLSVDFKIKIPKLEEMTDEEISNIFGLQKRIPAYRLYYFDITGKVQKYDSIESILNEYFKIRLQFYYKRKDYMIKKLEEDKKRLQKYIQFLEYLDNESVSMNNIAEIINKQFNADNDLLSMDVDSLTEEQLEYFKTDLEETSERLDRYNTLTPEQLWKDDLTSFINLWDKNIDNELNSKLTLQKKRHRE